MYKLQATAAAVHVSQVDCGHTEVVQKIVFKGTPQAFGVFDMFLGMYRVVACAI